LCVPAPYQGLLNSSMSMPRTMKYDESMLTLNGRVRYQVMNATPLDWKSEGHKLAELIKQYNFNG